MIWFEHRNSATMSHETAWFRTQIWEKRIFRFERKTCTHKGDKIKQDKTQKNKWLWDKFCTILAALIWQIKKYTLEKISGKIHSVCLIHEIIIQNKHNSRQCPVKFDYRLWSCHRGWGFQLLDMAKKRSKQMKHMQLVAHVLSSSSRYYLCL